MKIVFIGSSPLGLEVLAGSDKFEVVVVLCLKKRATPALYEVAQSLDLEVKLFDWIKDFKRIILSFDTSMPFFIYQLDMLVPGSLTKNYTFFNVHRGDLRTNRGPNPDIWPVLLGYSTTALSLHLINDKIDAGVLIGEYLVEIDREDDTRDVKLKLEKGLPHLVEQMYQYMKGKIEGKKLLDGTYRPWVTEADFTINLEEDSFEVIDRKIKSQRQYNGAILWVRGEKKYIVNISLSKTEDENEILPAKLNGQVIFLTVNSNPLYHPPPKFPVSKRI